MSKYGVWNDDIGFAGYSIYSLGYTCSNCGGNALDIEEYPYKSLYCPHCGAKMMNAEEMDGGENDD